MDDITKNKKNEANIFINRVFYSAGRACAKVIGLQKGVEWTKVSGSIKGNSNIIKNKVIGAAKDLKETAGNVKESFLSGFKSDSGIKTSGVKESPENTTEKEEKPIRKSKPMTKMAVQTEDKGEAKKPSRETKDISEELPNKDFENEIAKMDEQLKNIELKEEQDVKK